MTVRATIALLLRRARIYQMQRQYKEARQCKCEVKNLWAKRELIA